MGWPSYDPAGSRTRSDRRTLPLTATCAERPRSVPIRPRFVPIRTHCLTRRGAARLGGRHADRRPHFPRLSPHSPRPPRRGRRRSSRWGTASSPARAAAGSGNGSEPFGTRSGTDRAAFGCGALGCEYDPARVYGASEANDCHRSDVAPIESAPIAVEEKVNLACSGAKARDLWPARRRRHRALRRAAAGRPARRGGAARRRADGGGDGRCERRRLRRTGRRLRARLGAQSGGRTEHLPRRRRGARSGTPCPARREPSPRRCTGCGGRCGRPATSAPTTAWSRWATRRRSPRAAGSATRRTAGAGSPKAAARSGTPTPIGPPDRATVDLAGMLREAAAATGAEYLDLADAFDGHQLCDRRAQRVGPAGPSPADGRVVPPPLLRPRLDPRIPPPERLRPAGDRHLPRPPLRPTPRQLRLRRHARRATLAGRAARGHVAD